MPPPQATAIPPLAPTIEFVQDSKGTHAVDASSPAVGFVRFGLWDHAFADTKGTLFNGPTEAGNFVGADSRRFYIRVKDRSRAGRGRVTALWRTRSADLKNFIDAATDPTITLLETSAGSGVFASRALLLVTDKDDKQDVDSGLPAADPDSGVRTASMNNYRIRLGSMLGMVEAEYSPPPTGTKVKIFSSTSIFMPMFTGQKKKLPLQVFVLRRKVGGDPVIKIGATDDLWVRDLRIVRQIYERLGIFLETTIATADAKLNPVTISQGAASALLVDPPTPVLPDILSKDYRQQTLIPSLPIPPDTVRVFYAGQYDSFAASSFSSIDADTQTTDKHRGTCFIDAFRPAYTLAHEIGHVLTNKGRGHQGHFSSPGAPLNDQQNLMTELQGQPEGFNKTKRLWDANDVDGFNQVAAIIGPPGSHYLRPL